MRISTKRKRGCRTLETETETETERDDDSDIYINVKEYTKMTMRLKTGIELIWFEIMPSASFYSVPRNTPEVSRMF